jgi:hypothetical protein
MTPLGQLITAAAVIGGGYLVLRPKPAKSSKKQRENTGLTASQDCSTWTIVDETKTRQLSEEVFAGFVQRGNLEPWDISDAIVKRVAPECRTSEEDIRSLNELELYRNVFVETINRLLSMGKIDQDLYLVYKDELEAYLMKQSGEIKKS